MAEKFLRVTNAFTTTGDDGIAYRVLVITEFLGTKGVGKDKTSLLGETFLRTEDDKSLTRIAKGRYRITETGVILSTDALDAP